MARRNKKNKILRMGKYAMQTKDTSYNTIKRILDKDSVSIRKVLDRQDYIEKTLKEYLESNDYTVYLCKIQFPLRLTIIVSPQLTKNDLKNLKHDFGLSDYELEIEISDSLGQYYFR